jgi:hypothetical protein
VFEESRALAGKQQTVFPHGKGINRIAHGRLPLPAFVYDPYGHFRQLCQGTLDYQGTFFSPFNENFTWFVGCHVIRGS